jgi:hypothetical protein
MARRPTGLEKGDNTAAQRGRQRARVIVDQAIEARFLRAVESPRGLGAKRSRGRERLISNQEGLCSASF